MFLAWAFSFVIVWKPRWTINVWRYGCRIVCCLYARVAKNVLLWQKENFAYQITEMLSFQSLEHYLAASVSFCVRSPSQSTTQSVCVV